MFGIIAHMVTCLDEPHFEACSIAYIFFVRYNILSCSVEWLTSEVFWCIFYCLYIHAQPQTNQKNLSYSIPELASMNLRNCVPVSLLSSRWGCDTRFSFPITVLNRPSLGIDLLSTNKYAIDFRFGCFPSYLPQIYIDATQAYIAWMPLFSTCWHNK